MPQHCIPLHSCPSACGLSFPISSLAQALRLFSKPKLGVQCLLLGVIPPSVFHPAKPGRIPEQSQHSLYSHILLTAQGAAMACAAPKAPWLNLRLCSLVAGEANWSRTTAAESPCCPGTRGMLQSVHSFSHLHPEVSHTTHLSKPLLSANNKSQPRGGAGSSGRAGCWHPRACCHRGTLHQPLPGLLGSSRAGCAQGDG